MNNNEKIDKLLNLKVLAPSQEELEQARKEYLIWQKSSPNNFSYWFPKIKFAEDDVVKIPMSRIVSVPEDLLEAFFMEGNKAVEVDIKNYIAAQKKKVIIKYGCGLNISAGSAVKHLEKSSGSSKRMVFCKIIDIYPEL